ncbi:MAG: hypothetical protein DLM53_00360 [Candidatus Eremiobacter antarcticus]|nr:MAG: hypothetical protein DLM53_00360 [Candidatus Eremiobacter sp. RRmetagenome_bin22]
MDGNAAVHAAGIKAMLYSDPNRQAPSDPLYTSDETTFAHDCTGSRIQGAYQQYLMDPASSSLRTLWKNWIASQSVGVTWDAIFEDNANDVLYLPTLPCNYSAGSWLAAAQELNSAQAPTPIIYSGLRIDDEKELNVSPNVIGGLQEGCYSSRDEPKAIKYWALIENNEIAMAQQGKMFLLLWGRHGRREQRGRQPAIYLQFISTDIRSGIDRSVGVVRDAFALPRHAGNASRRSGPTRPDPERHQRSEAD